MPSDEFGDIPLYRIRAYVSAKRKAKRVRAKLVQSALHIKRVQGEVRVLPLEGDALFANPTTLACNLLLNELAGNGLTFYAKDPLPVGQRVGYSMAYPRPFYVVGKISSCQHTGAHSKIIATDPFPYRMRIKFEFASESERALVENQCRSIQEKLFL